MKYKIYTLSLLAALFVTQAYGMEEPAQEAQAAGAVQRPHQVVIDAINDAPDAHMRAALDRAIHNPAPVDAGNIPHGVAVVMDIFGGHVDMKIVGLRGEPVFPAVVEARMFNADLGFGVPVPAGMERNAFRADVRYTPAGVLGGDEIAFAKMTHHPADKDSVVLVNPRRIGN